MKNPNHSKDPVKNEEAVKKSAFSSKEGYSKGYNHKDESTPMMPAYTPPVSDYQPGRII